MGTLESRLRGTHPPLDGLNELINLPNGARVVRNDLIHALPVKHGLHRRLTKGPGCVMNFYSGESLREARELFERARRTDSEVLYSDGGGAIKRWYAQPTS